jgi:cell wall-associated NlpC family hydrolase
MGEISDFELMQRRQVVQRAIDLLNEGSHYLWGAQGGRGTPRLNTVGATDEETYLFTVSLGGHTQQYVCAGRCDHHDVRRLPSRRTLEQATQAAANGGAGFRWARYYRDGDTVNPSTPGLVFGESCVGKRHFDCAGFVRFCFRQVLNVPIRRMRDTATSVWRRTGNNNSLANVDIYPGDILYGHGHVGLATGRTEYGATSPNMAIHAYYAKAGVVATPITAAPNWTEVKRWNDWAPAAN